eukprot:g1680.t1
MVVKRCTAANSRDDEAPNLAGDGATTKSINVPKPRIQDGATVQRQVSMLNQVPSIPSNTDGGSKKIGRWGPCPQNCGSINVVTTGSTGSKPNQKLEASLPEGDKLPNVNEKDVDGDSLLHLAIYKQQEEFDMVKRLVESGANIDAKNNKNETPLLCAAWQGYFNIVKYLVDAGANVNTPCITNDTALTWSAYEGYPRIVKYLIDAGANVNTVGELQGNALHNACCW